MSKLILFVVLILSLTLAGSISGESCIKDCYRQQRKLSKTERIRTVIRSCIKQCYGEKTEEKNSVLSENDVIDQAKLWEQYRSELTKVLSRGVNVPNLQIVQAPMEALWDTEDPNQLQRLCDYVPYWGAYYTASPYKISNQYRSFILNVNAGYAVKDQQSKQALDMYNAELKQLSAQMDQQRSACMMKFIQLPAKQKGDFEQYLSTCLSGIRGKIEDTKIMIQFFTPRAYGIENDALQQARVESEVEMKYREAIGSLSRFRNLAKSGSGTSLSFSLNTFTQISETRSWSSVSKGISRPTSLNNSFFSFLTSDGKGGLATTSKKFKMSVKFQSYTAISVAPGSWFRHSVINQFRNGPFINRQPNLFGNGGTMRLMPTKFYVAYKPVMTLDVDVKDQYKFTGSKVKSSSGFFSSRSESAKITTNAINTDTVRITISSNNPAPIIIAVQSERLA